MHAGEQGEGEPQQHPLHLLLPHAGCLPMLQTQLGRAGHGHCMYLHSTHLMSERLLSISVVKEHACGWSRLLKDCDHEQQSHDRS